MDLAGFLGKLVADMLAVLLDLGAHLDQRLAQLLEPLVGKALVEGAEVAGQTEGTDLLRGLAVERSPDVLGEDVVDGTGDAPIAQGFARVTSLLHSTEPRLTNQIHFAT